MVERIKTNHNINIIMITESSSNHAKKLKERINKVSDIGFITLL